MKKVAFYTLGCKLNFSETSTIGRLFTDAGYAVVEFQDSADVYVINTCSVTENADKKCRKVVKEALKHSPNAYVTIVGCYAQLKPQEIAEIEGVDMVLGAAEKFRIVEFISDLRYLLPDYNYGLKSEIALINSLVLCIFRCTEGWAIDLLSCENTVSTELKALFKPVSFVMPL